MSQATIIWNSGDLICKYLRRNTCNLTKTSLIAI